MNNTFQDLMRDATRLTHAGQLNDATQVIQRALAGMAGVGDGDPPRSSKVPAPAVLLDGLAGWSGRPGLTGLRAPAAPAADVDIAPDGAGRGIGGGVNGDISGDNDAGDFIAGVHTHAGLTRHYKCYLPPGGAAGRSLPLVVMLHGCTQSPDDFAAGTGMNALADELGLCVLYPAQAQDANPSRCWNWFKHNHQSRERGEAALIADMTRAVAAQHGIDPARVYIAGLSAGGAMASLVAAAFPDVFAAVGVHSGLPPGAARSLPEGLQAMRSGADAGGSILPAGLIAGRALNGAAAAILPVPVIVFHGDADATVHPANGDQTVAAALRADPLAAGAAAGRPVIERGRATGGQRYTRTVYADGTQPALAEHWVVHGAGHAWSGGRRAGSYTDGRGPDASREMLRFFLSHRRRPGH